MKEVSSRPLAPRRVRMFWIVAALGACAVGLAAAVFLVDNPVVGVPSLFLGGLGTLVFVILLVLRLEQDRRAEKYGTDTGNES